jgi:predicted nucleotidyltransferase
MPAKKNVRVREINLVPKEGLESTTSGRVLLWILSTFRIILIITELVVIGAFISRFWLDAKNTDLTEEMSEKKSVITSLSEFEKDFKATQERLAIFNSYKANKGIITSNIDVFISYKPKGIYFKSINAGLKTVSVTASSDNEIEIQQYLANLKASGKYESVNISKINLSKNNTAFDFSLAVNIK